MSQSHRFPLVQFRENRTSQESLRSLLNHARYDNLNRINSFTDSGPVTQSYSYDQYGNKWLSAGSNNALEPLSSDWIDAATNRLSTTSGLFSYDNAGNLTLFGGVSMAYDAENRTAVESQAGFEPVLYLYDGAGQRVEKCQSNTAGVCDPAGSQTVSVYDAFGNLADEYSNGAPVAPYCTRCYISTDQLGSTRLVTGPAGNVVSPHDYLAFGYDTGTNYGRGNTGLPNSGWGQGDGVPQLYTGQVQDGETQFDCFRTRYYTRIQGRFHSPDPFNAGVDLTNPQSWNGYAYVNNNPLSNTDPWGLQDCPAPCSAYSNPGQSPGTPTSGGSGSGGGFTIWQSCNAPPRSMTISPRTLPMGGPLDVFYGAAKQATYDFADFLTSPFPNSTARDLLPYLRPNSRLQQNGAAAVGLATAATMIPEEGFAILPR